VGVGEGREDVNDEVFVECTLVVIELDVGAARNNGEISLDE